MLTIITHFAYIGHIISYSQADFVARFKRMSGFNTFYPFGFDDNGLPSERLVEKEQGKNKETQSKKQDKGNDNENTQNCNQLLYILP